MTSDFSRRAHFWRQYIACLMLISVFVSCKKNNETTEASPPRIDGNTITLLPNSPELSSIEVAATQPNNQAVTPMTGRLIWNDDLTVRIFTPVAGRVDQILVKVGQQVNKGDVLATVLSPDYGQAQSDVMKAEADLKLSQRMLDRIKDLYENGCAALKDVEAAQDDLENKKAEQQRALDRLKLYGGESGIIDQRFSLQSPIGGELVEKNINAGQEVRSDAILGNVPQAFLPLFVISDPKHLWLNLDVTEMDVIKLRVGQKLQLHSKAYPDKIFFAQLEVLSPQLDPTTRTIKALAVVDNDEKLLRAEMYVTVELLDVPSGGVTIPVKATFLKDGSSFVFVEKAPGQYERIGIIPGEERAGRVVVSQGLTLQQRVVTEGGLALEKMLEDAKKS